MGQFWGLFANLSFFVILFGLFVFIIIIWFIWFSFAFFGLLFFLIFFFFVSLIFFFDTRFFLICLLLFLISLIIFTSLYISLPWFILLPYMFDFSYLTDLFLLSLTDFFSLFSFIHWLFYLIFFPLFAQFLNSLDWKLSIWTVIIFSSPLFFILLFSTASTISVGSGRTNWWKIHLYNQLFWIYTLSYNFSSLFFFLDLCFSFHLSTRVLFCTSRKRQQINTQLMLQQKKWQSFQLESTSLIGTVRVRLSKTITVRRHVFFFFIFRFFVLLFHFSL